MAENVDLVARIKLKDEASKGLQRFGGALRALRIGLGLAAGAALTFAIKSAGEIEKTRIAFETLLGSTEEAGNLLKELTDFAARTPFDLPGVQIAAKQLLAVGAATRENVIPTLKLVGDVAAGTGAPLERIILNFGQVATQGKLTGRELRDFAVNGIPLIAELADMFEVTKEEITDMVSAGEVGFEDVRAAFERMSGEGGRFSNLMDKQSRTLPGIIENIKDKFGILTRAIIGVDPEGNIEEGGLFDRFKGIAQGLLNVIEDLPDNVQKVKKQISDWMKNIDKNTGIITFFKDLWVKLAEIWKVSILPALSSLWEIFKDLLPALKPVAGILGTALVGGLIVVAQTAQIVADTLQRVLDIIRTVIDKIKEFHAETTGRFQSGLEKLNIFGFQPFGKQFGGSVRAGQPVMVGERGAEMFVPNTGGKILSNAQSQGAGGSITINFNNAVVRSDSDLQTIVETVKETLTRENQLLRIGA